MKIPAPVPALVILALIVLSCKSSSSKGEKTFCDTACLKDSVKFTGAHPLHPHVYITARDCGADSIFWGSEGWGSDRKIGFDYPGVKVNRDFIRCVFKDTGYAYLLFNDCMTGRGYQLRLPFNSSGTISKRSSGINGLDPKFSIADDMIAYTDRGNIYVEEVSTGKKAMMTFGKAADMDYDVIHESLDSVNVTPTRIWVKVKIDKAWKELEKKITLE